MTEEKIFGPLTFKQFICFTLGVGLLFFLEPHLVGTTKYVVLFALGVVTMLAVQRFKPKDISIENMESYLEEKAISMEREAFLQMLRQKIANVSAQMSMRKARGLSEDPKLSEVAKVLHKLFDKYQSK
jgi:hypothetical protein